ncbi:acidic fibroblast growth factor binding protein [Entophlyctis helioformis]|nr:acidic fibroblast growth factor binding protein [Entophlyctis helioformis]
MNEFTAFFSNTIAIDKALWHMWLMGLVVDHAVNVTYNQHRKRAAALGTPQPELNQVTHYVYTQYRNFEILEDFLHQPRQLHIQPLFPLPPSTKQFLIESYYGFNERVMREILGKKLTSRVRKELDDVCQKTKMPIIGCRRMFDNLKRIIKRVEDSDGDMVTIIHRDFLLPPALSFQYANIIFINNYRFETSKKRLAHLRFSDFEYAASIFIQYFTASPASVLDELDANLAQDSRDLKSVLYNSKDTLDQLRSATVAHLAQIGHPHIMERPSPATNAFKVLLRNILTLGASLTNSKDVRDLFATLQEKVVDPCVSYGWSSTDLDLFLSTVVTVFVGGEGGEGGVVDTAIPLHMRRRYGQSFSRLVTGVKYAGVRLHQASAGSIQ